MIYANADATKSNAKTRIASASSRDRSAHGRVDGLDRDRRSRGDLANADTSWRRSTDPDKRSKRSLGEPSRDRDRDSGRRDVGIFMSIKSRATPGMDRRRSRRREAERSFPQIKTRSQMQNINKISAEETNYYSIKNTERYIIYI